MSNIFNNVKENNEIYQKSFPLLKKGKLKCFLLNYFFLLRATAVIPIPVVITRPATATATPASPVDAEVV